MEQLGFGLNLKRQHFGSLLETGAHPGVDWFELISENFFSDGGRPWAVVERIRREGPVALHGTSMGLGDPGGVQDRYLDCLHRLIERVEPALVSDHLCFVGMDGEYSHELLPLPFTWEAVVHVSTQIARVQERLKRRIAVENISAYVRFEGAEMDEADFVREVAQQADCHLLLDLNNVWVNGRNHGLDPEAYVRAMPAERVVEYHLAGATEAQGWWIDTHVGPVPAEVWSLYEFATRWIGPRSTLVEWDTDVPALDVAAAECEQARTRGAA